MIRNRLHSIDALSNCEGGRAARACRDNGARKIVAERYRKPCRSAKGQQPLAAAFGATHVDRVYRSRLDWNLNFIRARLRR